MSSCSFPVFEEQEGECTYPKTFLIEGTPIPQFFTSNPAALRDYIVNFQTRADDVFVVSYPKSGKLGLCGKTRGFQVEFQVTGMTKDFLGLKFSIPVFFG